MRVNGNLQIAGQFLGLRLEELATDPDGTALSAYGSRIWKNTTDNKVKVWDGVDVVTIAAPAALSAFTQNVDAVGYLLKGLGAPVDSTDAIRKIDLDNAIMGLDFQADVASVLNTGDTPVSGKRYILGTYDTGGVGSTDDIISYGGTAFTLEYDVSAKGSGAIVYVTGASQFYRYDTSWTEFAGLTAYTVGNGLNLTNSVITLVPKENGGITVDSNGISVDTTVIATKASVDAVTTRITESSVVYTDETAATSHVVAHNLGFQYPIVQVIDMTDGQPVLPDSITFTDANNLTVVTSTAIVAKVLVTWAKAVA